MGMTNNAKTTGLTTITNKDILERSMADNPNFTAMNANERIEAGKRAEAALEAERAATAPTEQTTNVYYTFTKGRAFLRHDDNVPMSEVPGYGDKFFTAMGTLVVRNVEFLEDGDYAIVTVKHESDDTVYKVEVIRPDGLIIDTFYTGYPERDIANERESYCGDRNNYVYSVSVAQ